MSDTGIAMDWESFQEDGMVQVDPIYFLDVLHHITVYDMDLHGITVRYVYCIEFRYNCSNPAQTQCHCWLAASLQNECT